MENKYTQREGLIIRSHPCRMPHGSAAVSYTGATPPKGSLSGARLTRTCPLRGRAETRSADKTKARHITIDHHQQCTCVFERSVFLSLSQLTIKQTNKQTNNEIEIQIANRTHLGQTVVVSASQQHAAQRRIERKARHATAERRQ